MITVLLYFIFTSIVAGSFAAIGYHIGYDEGRKDERLSSRIIRRLNNKKY